MDGLRVLILDDNHHMCTILRTVLQGAGIRDVVEARDAASGFEALRNSVPDLALVDFQLGDLDGLEFTRLVRTADDSPMPHLPIIMVTAHSERSRVKDAIDAGVNEFVVKPVSARALVERINTVINNPRPFVKAPGYFGPDRRRRSDQNYRGPWRRSDDSAPEKSAVDI